MLSDLDTDSVSELDVDAQNGQTDNVAERPSKEPNSTSSVYTPVDVGADGVQHPEASAYNRVEPGFWKLSRTYSKIIMHCMFVGVDRKKNIVAHNRVSSVALINTRTDGIVKNSTGSLVA